MLVKNLVHWAGTNWDHPAGAEIELEEDVAVARTAAGLASPVIADADELKAFTRKVEACKRRTAEPARTAA